jgi:hypothetical protein
MHMLAALEAMKEKEAAREVAIRAVIKAAWDSLPYLPENDDYTNAPLRAALRELDQI